MHFQLKSGPKETIFGIRPESGQKSIGLEFLENRNRGKSKT
ncbi:hypothetical protein TDB9533_01109 [Thalassocella blandensis]|nr:hypothetical protein TDB9533_01109 [Thalassocella blandensis]